MASVYRRERDFEAAFVFALFKRSSDPLDFPAMTWRPGSTSAAARQRHACSSAMRDCSTVCFQTRAAAPLPSGANSQVGNPFALSHDALA